MDRTALLGEAQRSICQAINAIGHLPDHPLLDDATRLLGECQDKLALWLQEGTTPPPAGLLFWMQTKEPDVDAFAIFWKAYPYKRDKKKAKKAWDKLKPGPALMAVLLAALEAQKTTEQWQRGIIPHASTWLNNERWEDERSPELLGRNQGSGRFCADPSKYAQAPEKTEVCEDAQRSLFSEQTPRSEAGVGGHTGLGVPTGGW